MLFRAIFWIGVVALLMPRSGGIEIPGVPVPKGATEIAASTGDDFRDVLLQRLASVRADIEAAERSRAHSGG